MFTSELLQLLFVVSFDAKALHAFVVPTGSQATTIQGHHRDVTCPRCGARFPVNASLEAGGADPGFPPSKANGCTCFNCRFTMDFEKDKVRQTARGGDRILVTAVLNAEKLPRHSLIVHKFPPAWFSDKPKAVYYVSRLAGLPGETLAIHQGRLYRCSDLKYPKADVEANELWRRDHCHRDDPAALKAFAVGKFQMIRKTPGLLLAQRRPVHDHDFPAKDAEQAPPRWAAEKGSAWTALEGQGFKHPGAAKDLHWLRYRHIVRGAAGGKPRPELITDFLSYNSTDYGEGGRQIAENWVGDLMLECELEFAKSEGQFVLELNKGVDRFAARWRLDTGQCTLVRTDKAGKEVELATKPTDLAKPGRYRLRFANCEDRLTVWVNDRLPFGDGIAYDAPKVKGPAESDLSPVAIGSSKAAAQVRHLRIWRDTYYCLDPMRSDAGAETDWSDSKAWERWNDLPARTFFVQPGHGFVLGDNSPASSDSRDWGVTPLAHVYWQVQLRYFPFDRLGQVR